MNFRALCVFSLFALSLLLAVPIAEAQVSTPAPYASEMRDTCIAEMKKDAVIQVACETQYSNDYHEQDSRRATKNKKHVILAYGALWGIVTLFVVALWLKQRKLTSEIARLESELKKASAE